MENITRTANGALLQTTQLLGLPHVVLPNTTLNEKFNIHKDVTIADSEHPSLKYVVIGNGGHKMSTGTNGLAIPEPLRHRPRDNALYQHVPFVLRLPQNDLTTTERAKYRLRRSEVHDGVTYVAYYARVLDLSTTSPQLEYRTVDGDVTTSTAYTPSVSDLNPTPPAVNSQGAISTTGDYIAATAKVPWEMDANDIAEFLNVATILYGSEKYAVISEVALCSGVDRSVTGDFNGVSSSYTDAIGVQIASFYLDFFSVSASNEDVGLTFDVGATEAMLDTSQ